MNYYPDYWQVISIQKEDCKPIYKVFATFVGGYTQGDEWRLNSGIVSVERVKTKNSDRLHFAGSSGSQYACTLDEGCYRTSAYSGGILLNMIKNATEAGVDIRVLPFETNFEELDYESSN
jgi:hypothetical protein